MGRPRDSSDLPIAAQQTDSVPSNTQNYSTRCISIEVQVVIESLLSESLDFLGYSAQFPKTHSSVTTENASTNQNHHNKTDSQTQTRDDHDDESNDYDSDSGYNHKEVSADKWLIKPTRKKREPNSKPGIETSRF